MPPLRSQDQGALPGARDICRPACRRTGRRRGARDRVEGVIDVRRSRDRARRDRPAVLVHGLDQRALEIAVAVVTDRHANLCRRARGTEKQVVGRRVFDGAPLPRYAIYRPKRHPERPTPRAWPRSRPQVTPTNLSKRPFPRRERAALHAPGCGFSRPRRSGRKRVVRRARPSPSRRTCLCCIVGSSPGGPAVHRFRHGE